MLVVLYLSKSIFQKWYVEWCLELPDPSESLRDFITFVKERREKGSEEQRPEEKEDPGSRKRPREDKCLICATNPYSAAFIPCGHVVCFLFCCAQVFPISWLDAKQTSNGHVCICHECAANLADRRCLICRKRATTVQRLYIG